MASSSPNPSNPKSSAKATPSTQAKAKAKATPAQPPRQPPKGMSPERFARLQAEAAAPFRGLRRFIYAGCLASGGIGAFIFLTQILARRDLEQALPNLAVQLGVMGLMVVLLWRDRNP